MAVANNSTEPSPSMKLASTVVAIHLVTFFLGFITNGLLIFTITRLQHVRMKSVANYYILNLSIADILFVSVLPFNAHSTYNHKWMFGELVCRFANAFFHSTKFVSVFTLIVLTIDRLMATYPSKSHWRRISIGKVVISFIWFINLPIFTIYFYYGETSLNETNSSFKCSLEMPPSTLQAVTIMDLMFILGLPVVVIVACYTMVMRRILHISRKSNRVTSARMRKTVLAIVILFIFCHAPYEITNAVEVFHWYHASSVDNSLVKAHMTFSVVSEVLIFIASFANPIIYGLLNENYREMYKVSCGLFPCWKSGQQSDLKLTLTATGGCLKRLDENYDEEEEDTDRYYLRSTV